MASDDALSHLSTGRAHSPLDVTTSIDRMLDEIDCHHETEDTHDQVSDFPRASSGCASHETAERQEAIPPALTLMD